MDRDAILAFARRDWSRVAEAKADDWIHRKHDMTPADVLALGDQLRLYVKALRPDWPGQSDADDDLAVHARVAEALRAVSLRSC